MFRQRRARPTGSVHYKVAIYNPHLDEAALYDVKWCYDAIDVELSIERFERWLEAAKGQGCGVCQWDANDFHRYYKSNWKEIAKEKVNG